MIKEPTKPVSSRRADVVIGRRALVNKVVVTKKPSPVMYTHSRGVDDFVKQVYRASPMELVEVERAGVNANFLKGLSKRLDVPSARIFSILGIPKATAEKKSAKGEMISGSGGQAAIAMAKLLGLAQEIVANSTAPEAKGFDSAAWLGKWLECAQPSLGGRKPADLIDTPTGVEIVTRLLGSIESGAYQ
jgi:putative toxin-antitoxin system antitoxin component (TIGR02293 family)